MEHFESYICRLECDFAMNVVLFTNRIKAEWYFGADDKFYTEYPNLSMICANKMIRASRLRHVKLNATIHLKYVSEDFSRYPTFIKVYSMSISDREVVLSDMKKVYELLNPHLKMIRFRDYDSKFLFN